MECLFIESFFDVNYFTDSLLNTRFEYSGRVTTVRFFTNNIFWLNSGLSYHWTICLIFMPNAVVFSKATSV